MPTGIIRKWVDGSQRVDGQAFGFIQPDDGTPDVFAPARTLKGKREQIVEGLEVIYDLKDDDRKGTPMASSWKLPDASRSRSRGSRGSSSSSSSSSSSRSRTRSLSLQRPSQLKPASSHHKQSRSPHAQSQKQHKSRSPPKIPVTVNTTQDTFKVTVCDIPSAMSHVELEYLVGDIGVPVVSSKTYRSGERFHGLVEFYDMADADACIIGLDGKSVPGGEFKLRCVHGELEAQPTPRVGAPARPPRQKAARPDTRQEVRRRSRSIPRNRRSPPHGPFITDDKVPGISTFVRDGDWECSNCGQNVFGKKKTCPFCGVGKRRETRRRDREERPKERRRDRDRDRPRRRQAERERPRERERSRERPKGHKKGSQKGADIRPGDWTCPQCGENVFASKVICFKCGAPKNDDGGNHRSDRGRDGDSSGRGDGSRDGNFGDDRASNGRSDHNRGDRVDGSSADKKSQQGHQNPASRDAKT